LKNYKKYITEGEGLHVFDIDETLFKTSAKIHVKDPSGKTVSKLSNQEFNDHKLKPGHSYDFKEFKSAKKFHDESEPIHPMINKLNAIHKNIKEKGHNSKIIMNTARADFDDKHTFLNKFKKHGIDVNDTHIHRAGNIPGNQPPAEKKNVVLRKHLNSGNYHHVHMYDDSKTNLNHFLKLQKEYPKIKFHAHHVTHEGKTRKHIHEAAYAGNIGAMEMFKFFEKANAQQKDKLKEFIRKKENKAAWQLVQDVTGVKLHKSVHEEYGAGEDGTNELRKKYQKDTPGQKIKSFTDYVKTK
jgi:hypothetical protein